MQRVNDTKPNPSETYSLASAWLRLRGHGAAMPGLDMLPHISVNVANVETLASPAAFRSTLIEHIAQARQRILISALYLQDDDGGREVLTALYSAKKQCPQLTVAVFVDWHRAQRGLIGKARSAGNAAFYQEMAQRLGPGAPA